jgi:hypothetical protein
VDKENKGWFGGSLVTEMPMLARAWRERPAIPTWVGGGDGVGMSDGKTRISA